MDKKDKDIDIITQSLIKEKQINIIDKKTETLNTILNKLIQDNNKHDMLSEEEYTFLIKTTKEIFKSEPSFVELESPIKICGDIHGQYNDLLRIFNNIGYPSDEKFLFLGDYVDRGKNSLECIGLLLAFKIKYPNNIYLLRGNHEAAAINRVYGFYDECKRRYNIKLWKAFTDLFNWIPMVGSVDDRIICMHGGLSPDLKDLDNLRKIPRPTEIPEKGLLCDLLWSDPDRDISLCDWGPNDRGLSFTFSRKVIEEFLKEHDLDLIVRAHQVVENGYEFFANRKLVTIFSAPNYCGEFDNSGGVLSIDEDLNCHFEIIKPIFSYEKAYTKIQNRSPTPPKKNVIKFNKDGFIPQSMEVKDNKKNK